MDQLTLTGAGEECEDRFCSLYGKVSFEMCLGPFIVSLVKVVGK